LNAIKSVRLKVEHRSFNGSLFAFALFWFRIWCRPTGRAGPPGGAEAE